MESLETTTRIEGHNVLESVYRADKAIAASDLKYAVSNGLQAFHTYKYGIDNPPRVATPAMKFGSMFHKAILEPKDFANCYQLLDDKRSKRGKELALAFQTRGIETYTSTEFDTIAAIRKSLEKNAFVSKYLINDIEGASEQSYWWTHKATSLQCKCRCDYVIHSDMVIDLKTTGEGGASPDAFTRTIVNFKYHLQAAHYLQGTGCKKFVFVAVEKVFPYTVAVYELSGSFIEKGFQLQEQTLQQIKQAQESGIWAGHSDQEPDGIKTLTPPKWI